MAPRDEATGLEVSVRAALDEVLDPCSTFTERPQSIVDLGLVDGVDVDDGTVTVDLLPTNQLCMYIPHMSADIETRVGAIRGVEAVEVDVVADAVWTRDRMTPAAARERADHFESRVRAHGISPAYDGEEWADDVDIGPTE